MKKIFACSNGIEFFSDGESVLGALPKEEAMDFVSSIAIDKSYVQLPKVVEIEIVIVVL